MNLINNDCSCGAVQVGKIIFTTRDYNFNTTSELCSVLRCAACGSLYPKKFPDLDSLSKAYSSYYTAFKERKGIRRLLHWVMDATRRDQILRETPRNAQSVLDYGCGSGDFLAALKGAGYEARLYGTDLFKPAIFSELGFLWLPLDQFDADGNSFDWITLSHVIEHVRSGDVIMARLKNITLNTGMVWLSTPNADSFLFSSFEGYARDVDFPRHRQIFSRNAISSMFNKAGYQVEFHSSARLSTFLNYTSCVKNVWRSKELTFLKRTFIISAAGIRLCLHLVLPTKLRDAEAPELIVVAKPSVCHSRVQTS